MRKLLFGLALLAAAGAAQADNGIYVGGAVSQVKLDDIGQDFDENNLDDFKIDDTAWKLIVGVRPLSFLAVEANYMDLGSESRDLGIATVDADAKAIAAYVIGFLPIPIVDVYAKVGAAHWELDGSLRGTTLASIEESIDESGTDFAYGAGAQLKFGSLAARLEYEQFDVEGTDGLEMLSLGLTYTFL